LLSFELVGPNAERAGRRRYTIWEHAMRVRKTRQLSAILHVLERADRPMSIGEIRAAAQTHEDGLGVATVYRAVKALIEEGAVLAVDLPGEASRFELSGKGHHHHFQCNECGRVFETKACIDNLRRLLPRRFQLTGHEIVLYGRCSECRTA
jgi:Fur family ferric uptake transcriptional regulator